MPVKQHRTMKIGRATARTAQTAHQRPQLPTPRPKPKRRFPAEVLSPQEVAALLDACGRRRTPTCLRNRALIAVLYRSGLRISEALALEAKDIDQERSAIRVLFAKGGRSRTVGIDRSGMAELAAWLEVKGTLGLGEPEPGPLRRLGTPLFCILNGPARGEALDSGYVRLLFKRLSLKAGIRKRVHPHGLRHTHAAELRQEGFDIGIISKQLGHRDISTTARYLDHVAPWSVVEAVAGRNAMSDQWPHTSSSTNQASR